MIDNPWDRVEHTLRDLLAAVGALKARARHADIVQFRANVHRGAEEIDATLTPMLDDDEE